MQNPGERIRAEILAPALGILNAMPIYRSEWGGMGTISRRFTTCNSQIRGVPLEPQSDEYRDLEYYSVLCQQRTADLRPGGTAMRDNMRKSTLVLAAGLLIAGATSALAAATEPDFKAAYAAAEAANKQAAALRNQWTTTAAALAAAKKAADSGDFDQAIAEPRRPKPWRKPRSTRPSSEKDAWKALEIH